MDLKKVKLDSKNDGSEGVASAKDTANPPGERMEVDMIVGKPPTPDQDNVTADSKMLDRLDAVCLDSVVDKSQSDAVKKQSAMMTEPVNADDEVNRTRLPSTPRSAKFSPDCVGGWETGTRLATDPLETQQGIGSDTDNAVMAFPSTYSTASMVENVDRAEMVDLCVAKDSLEYDMSHRRRGRAVIFNHVEFANKAQERKGSNADKEHLETTLKQLGFNIRKEDLCDDFTYERIKQKITLLHQEDHSDADCLVIAILTHGENSDLLWAKDQLYSFELMWKSFTADYCPRLAGKPKIFFVQACRGDLTDLGVRVTMPKSESKLVTDNHQIVYQLPSHADFLLAYSSVDGHYAYRNAENGSWFIQSLCKELKENDTSKVDLQRILTKTARRVALDFPTDEEKAEAIAVGKEPPKQVPTILSTLIREVYFTPKPSASHTQQV